MTTKSHISVIKRTRTIIAMADDDPDIVAIMQTEFKRDRKYQIRYYNGASILKDLRSDLDLVVLDVKMPRFNVLRAVKRINRVTMAYIIIISADRDFDGLVNMANEGIFRFCKKEGVEFLPRLRKDIKDAHAKIKLRNKLMGERLFNA